MKITVQDYRRTQTKTQERQEGAWMDKTGED